MNIALILSGGKGMRFGGDVPKQYTQAGGRPVIGYALEVFEKHEKIDRIQIVADRQWQELILHSMADGQPVSLKPSGFSRPGESRQMSIYNGLKDIMEYAHPTDKVLIHDAVRPLVKAERITEVIETLEKHEAVTPVVPVKDTVYTCEGGRFTGILRRDTLAAGQTPEGFLLGRYYEAVQSMMQGKMERVTGSLEAALLAGMDAVSVAGDEENFKITAKEDLMRFRQLLRERRGTDCE